MRTVTIGFVVICLLLGPASVRSATRAHSPQTQSTAVAQFVAPPAAPPLPAPTGTIVNVSTVGQLQNAFSALASNTTIMIAPGTYHPTEQLRVRNGVTNVTVRGATDNRNDVVLVGTGMNTQGAVDIVLKVENAQDVTIANLTIGDCFFHPIQLQGEQGCDRVRVYNVRLYDAGEQFLKGTGTPGVVGVDDGVVEYCVIEYTTIGPADGYTNGVDIHDGANWIIRYNLFRNIRVPLNAPERLGPAVLMWSGSRNTICDSNTFVDCERAVAFGLGPQAGAAHGHDGGMICNNFIYRSAAIAGDSAISVWDSPNTKVFHNSVYQSGTYPTSIEYRFGGSSGIEVKNNLTDGTIIARDGAQATLAGNATGASSAMFANVLVGDLHLVATATLAIDGGAALSACPLDWDLDTRSTGPARDIGADEYSPFAHDTAGIYVPASAAWFLRNSNSNGSAAVVFGYGPSGAGWIPLAGDWDGDGDDTPGLYAPATGTFFLRNTGSPGAADLAFSFGPPGAGWAPLVGDWNGDGTDTIGLYDPVNGAFFLRNANGPGAADLVYTFGPSGGGFTGLAGDWNGDGIDTVGIHNASTAAFFLRNSHGPGAADITVVYGGSGATPITGDWDGSGTDTIGIYVPATGAWFLRNANAGGAADIVFTYGPPGVRPLPGDWDGR